jgi:hypothetical protein
MSKTKVRVPSNIQEEVRLDELGNEYINYIYDEVVYDINEFLQVNDEDIQENIDVTMMALDYSYMESSELFDMLMMALDEIYMTMDGMYSELLNKIKRL